MHAFLFHIFFHSCTIQVFAKSVDRWTRSCFYISCFLSFLYPIKCFIKVWTCGQEAVFYFMFSFFLVPYKMFCKSVDLWTRSCFSISCFLSLLYPFIFWQKVWTGGQALKILKILMTTFFLVPFKIFAKNVDGWTRRCFYILCFFLFCTL